MALPQVIIRPDGSLYCDVSIESLGFMSFTPLCSLPIQYDSSKFKEMGDIFVGLARSTCPVDTGYLRDHNDYAADAGGIEMWSEAFYSAYQEYGTSRCRAQPWFESSILSALADSGIEDNFTQTQTRWNYVDGELAAVQAASPTSIGEAYALIYRINNLQNELSALGIYVEGLQESLEQLEAQVQKMIMQMQIQMALSQGKMNMGFFEQMIISLIAGFIGGLIRFIIGRLLDNKEAQGANPHNPSHG